MRRIENPNQPYPFNEQELPYTPMTEMEAEACYNFAIFMGEDNLIDVFEELLAKSGNIEDVASLVSAASVGERYSDNPDNDLRLITEPHPVGIFAYGVCFGLWASCPDMSRDGSVFVSDEMNASITAIENQDPQKGLFEYAQACIDFVHDNDQEYYYLAQDVSGVLYNQYGRVPFLYGSAAGRMLYAFRQADIKSEINEAWNQHNQRDVISLNSNPWLN